MNEQNTWIDIITKLYKDLHLSKRVMHTSTENDKKRDRIIKYFERLERVQNKVVESKSPAALAKLKEFYYDLYVIKPENIPDKYFENEQRIMRERGYGNIEITEDRRKILVDQIIEDQKKSLEPWIDYFLFDEEAKSYETWEKYWVFQGLKQLGKFDKESLKFSKRDKTTVYPFPPVEREAIFTTLHLMEEYIKDKKGDNEIKSALGAGNFKTLYEYSIKQIMQKGERKLSNTTQGKWVKYDQGSDYNLLRDSLQGYYTGWCTAAGENFAKSQLANGDFYVYYTLDENNEPKVPRIAIRMEGHDTIGEIRGIADNQNMEPEMMPILNEKLEEFPDRDKYYKKEYDMQRLTSIDNKAKKGMLLDREDLEFLYEINDKIEGFGFEEDPRIEEIKQGRNKRQDYALIYNCKEEEIGLTKEELQKGNIKVFGDSLDLRKLKSADGLNLPEIISGDLNLSGLTSSEGLKLPEKLGGSLYLFSLTSAKGLKLPEKLNGSLGLDFLTIAEGLILPKTIGGSLNLFSLASAEGLNLPETIGGTLNLNSLTSAEGLTLPETIGGGLYLKSLTSAEDLTLPKTIGGYLDLSSLTSAEGLILPETIGGNLDLSSLTSVEGLTLPETINGELVLSSLTSAEGLILPETIDGDLDLYSLTSVEGLTLPKTIGGSLYLNSLTSVEGLTLSKTIGGNLYLSSLTSAKGLTLPKTIGGYLDLYSLTSAEGLTLPKTIGDDLDLSSLTSAKGLTLPETIGGNLDLSSLTSAEGLTLPETIGSSLNLCCLTSAEGLTLPETIGSSLYLSSLTSAKGLTLPKTIGGNLDLRSLTSVEGLQLPYDFPLEKLICSENVMNEIKANPQKYYRQAPVIETKQEDIEDTRHR